MTTARQVMAELSAQRRALRAAGWPAHEVIAAQLDTVRRFSFYRPAVARRQELLRLFVLQGGQCYLCDEPMRSRGPVQDPTDATRDHVTPRHRRGRNVDNLLAAHRGCNEDKGSRSPYPCELLYLAAINARRTSRSNP